MDFIAFPLRIGGDGWMRRCRSSQDARREALEIMGRTPGDGGWRGVKEFGLRDYMMAMGTRRGLQPEAIQAANRILNDLDVRWFRIDAIEKEEGRDPSEAVYRVSVFFAGRG